MRAIIIGGGIGGLTAAVAFHQRGWQVEVLERAPEFTEVGAGLAIQPNGLHALDLVGLGDCLRERALADPLAGIRTARGRWLIRNNVPELKRRFGQWVTVHRAELVDLLRAAVPAEALRPGTDVHEVRSDGTVVHSGGTSTGDVVVGADGVRSTTRRSLWPQAAEPRYAGYTTWRFIVPAREVDESVETWGRGIRFGQQPMPDGRIYCYVMANAPRGSQGGLGELRDQLAKWHDPIPALVDAASGELIRHDTLELPDLRSYVTGQAALLGDAAHAMTPNLGQGACQAMEDAVTLAATVDSFGVRAGLAEYDRQRRPRTQGIARMSRQIGMAAHRLPAGPRDVIMPLLPDSLFARSITHAYTWTLSARPSTRAPSAKRSGSGPE